jgi:hypothetical protein
MMHAAWTYDSMPFELQAYESIALQYYYMGMIDKSSQYHRRTIRGAMPGDRPKGFELQRPKDAVAISLKTGEVSSVVYDGSIKIVVSEDRNYSKSHDIKDFAQNLWQRLQIEMGDYLKCLRAQDDVHPDLLKTPEPVSLYQEQRKKTTAGSLFYSSLKDTPQ